MMNWKGRVRKRSWPNLRYYTGICLEELRETTKNLTQDSRSPGQDLNLEPQKRSWSLGAYLALRVVLNVIVNGIYCLSGIKPLR
jgi:hypothetical protein